MNRRNPLSDKNVDANVQQAPNFSFDKATQKKQHRNQNECPGKKSPNKQKQLINMLLGDLKEQNHEKMIQMFTGLLKQLKQKQQQNSLLLQQLQDLNEQFTQVKLQYGRCLKQKSILHQQTQCLSARASLKQSQMQALQSKLKQTEQKQQQNNYYKSQLFTTTQKLKQYQAKYAEKYQYRQDQQEFKLNQMHSKYQMKLDEAEQHIKEVQRENWQLAQLKIRNQTLVRKYQLQISECQHDIKRITQNGTSFTQGNPQGWSREQAEREIELLKKQLKQLRRYLEKKAEEYQLKIIESQSQIDLERFKTQTYAEHVHSLEQKISSSSLKTQQLKRQNLRLVEQFQHLQKRWIDTETLLKQMLSKVQQILPHNHLLMQYCQILKSKVERIEEGKNVMFLKSNTKQFICLSSRSKQQNNSISYDFCEGIVNQKGNKSFRSDFKDDEYESWRKEYRNDCSGLKQNPHQEAQTRILNHSKPQDTNDKLESKILQERKSAQIRIRQKYMRPNEKAPEQSSKLKYSLNPTSHYRQNPHRQTEENQSPYFSGKRDSFHLTSQFQQ